MNSPHDATDHHGDLPASDQQWRFRDRRFDLHRRVLVMGILNVTPDSFSEQGRHAEAAAAIDAGQAMLDAGADVLDIGGESSRPGAATVETDEEIRRVVPVIRELRRRTVRPISIDTTKAAVAEAALAAGADIVNDISGFTRDPDLARVAAAHGAGCVVMHMRGTAATMTRLTDYDDLFGELHAFYDERLAALADVGVPPERVCLDPGIGFAKTADQSLRLIASLDRLLVHGRPLLLGPSRKSFIGKTLGIDDPLHRQWGTAAALAVGILRGARILRVHDVAEMRQVCHMSLALIHAGDADQNRPAHAE